VTAVTRLRTASIIALAWGTKRYLNMKHLYELEKIQEYEKELKKAKMDVA
jgi:hypothetical protein